MKAFICIVTFTVFFGFCTGPALAQELMVFPAKGQSDAQMEKDKYQCYSWAKNQSGFDPMAEPKTSSPPPQRQTKQGGVFRGAARGAAVGAVTGAVIDGKKGARRGAGGGAAGGALIGGMRRKDQLRQQHQAEQQWAEQEAAKYTQKRNTYNRAYAACLEGKGYTVK